MCVCDRGEVAIRSSAHEGTIAGFWGGNEGAADILKCGGPEGLEERGSGKAAR